EATRPQEQVRRFPLRPGDTTWVGVQRVHTLASDDASKSVEWTEPTDYTAAFPVEPALAE
ncbi:MAG TPA: hypothetical protein VKB76_02640, partial [Ktedonobacterales bacterium]|nr:hypothetical protein [Ktedonobacterales bacterium]